jgi:hypothetical protein
VFFPDPATAGSFQRFAQWRPSVAKQRPEETLSLSAGNGTVLNAAIWAHQNGSGQNRFTSYSVTTEKRYRDDDEWKTTDFISASELLVLAHLLTKAYDKITELRAIAGGEAA